MIEHALRSHIQRRRCTLLGVGPMSVNCVDSTIEIANEYDTPIMMIASRRQVECESQGGGYVNNWSTEQFSKYVTDRDKKGKVLLCRDHGGPWQNSFEQNKGLGLKRAMESAKQSYKVDIASGFQILHLDPSIDIHGKPDIEEILNRLFELYEFCWSQAREYNQKVLFEIGTEEQSGSTNSQDELDFTLSSVLSFCKEYKVPKPTFVVIQCGTRVMEMRNVGSFDSPVRVANEIPTEIQLPKMIEICNKYEVFMKAHNTDYLSDESLQWHPRFGIHAANVAPEFGVTETKALIKILEENDLQKLSEKFLDLFYSSRKWEKWMINESTATDRERSYIAGHYTFACEDFKEIKAEASCELKRKDIELDMYLKHSIKENILRYLKNFRMVKAK